jgi:hypothetical protein
MIRNILKSYIIPPGIMAAVKSLERLGTHNSNKNSIYSGFTRDSENCAILASGPSIADINLKLLGNIDAIAVSMFHVHEETPNLNIKHHVLAPQHDPFTFADSVKIFKLFKERYSALKPHILLGLRRYQYSYDKLLEAYPEYNCFNYSYVHFDSNPEIWNDNYRSKAIWDLGKTPFPPRTVVYTAIQLAAYAGYKRIFLFGVDHNYINDLSKVKDLHFYPDNVGIDDSKHLEKYFNKEAWFYEYYKRWHQYKLMREYLNENGIEIFNCSPKSYLDVFTNIDMQKFMDITK